MGDKEGFGGVAEGSRVLYRLKSSAKIFEDVLLERSPSKEFTKFRTLGWASAQDLALYELVEVICSGPLDGDDMCPNCVTPWKCNGPHIKPCRGAPGGSHQLERYIDSLGLSNK